QERVAVRRQSGVDFGARCDRESKKPSGMARPFLRKEEESPAFHTIGSGPRPGLPLEGSRGRLFVLARGRNCTPGLGSVLIGEGRKLASGNSRTPRPSLP